MSRERVEAGLRSGAALFSDAAERFSPLIETLSESIAKRLGEGGRVLACGNGGSASDAEHVACELAGRFRLDRPPLDVLALTTNSSLTTALANDYGFDEVFARQVRAHGRSGDYLLLFTTSGSSSNVVRARDAARELSMRTVAFTGERGEAFAEACNAAFVVPSGDTPRIQEVHIALAHALCEEVERCLFGADA